MKCFKFLFIFIFSISNMALAQISTENLIEKARLELEQAKNNNLKEKSEAKEVIEVVNHNKVIPIEMNKALLNNGEIYKVFVDSEKTNDEIKKFKNKMINEVMYVMEVLINGDERFFKVFVTDPPKKKKKKKDIIFDMSSFDYKPIRKESGADFFSFDMPFELETNKNYVVMSIVGFFVLMLSIPLIWFLYKYFKTRKKKVRRRKMEIRRAKDLIELLEEENSRKKFEKIYHNRREIKRLLDINEITFSNLIIEIDKFQYQKVWTTVELESIKKKFDLLRDYRVGRGI